MRFKFSKSIENVQDFLFLFFEFMYVAGGSRNECTSDTIKVYSYFESCPRRIRLSKRAEEVRHQRTGWRENETERLKGTSSVMWFSSQT